MQGAAGSGAAIRKGASAGAAASAADQGSLHIAEAIKQLPALPEGVHSCCASAGAADGDGHRQAGGRRPGPHAGVLVKLCTTGVSAAAAIVLQCISAAQCLEALLMEAANVCCQ